MFFINREENKSLVINKLKAQIFSFIECITNQW